MAPRGAIARFGVGSAPPAQAALRLGEARLGFGFGFGLGLGSGSGLRSGLRMGTGFGLRLAIRVGVGVRPRLGIVGEVRVEAVPGQAEVARHSRHDHL